MFSDKVVVVTGAGQGIGQSIADEFRLRNAKVVYAYRSAKQIEQPEPNKLIIPTDVSRLDSCVALIQNTIDKFHRLDILVNNAGINHDELLIRMKDSDWDDVMNINLKGLFYCTRAAAKIMIKQRSGVIINITSVVGEMGNAGQANYAASKAGIIGFSKSVAKELASRNIRVNAVSPGFIETRMTNELSDNWKNELIKQIPLGRLGQPADIAKTVCYLASDDAGYITGQVIRVDGGLLMA